MAIYINVLVSVKKKPRKMAILCISNASLVPELKFLLAPPPLVGGGPPLSCRGGPPPRLGVPLPRLLFLLLRFPRPLGEGGRVGEGGGVGEGLRDLELLPLGSPTSYCIGYSMVSSLNIAVK